VTPQPTRSEVRSPYWAVPIARAVPALAIAAVVAFMPNHPALVGGKESFAPNHSSAIALSVFGGFALASGIVLLVMSLRFMAKSTERLLFIVQSAVSIVAGALALVLALNDFDLAFLLYLVSVFGAITGALELYSGIRARGTAPAKDWIAVGGFTAILALVFLLLPLTDLVATGLLGAYGALLGVYFVIAGLSLRWGTQPSSSSKSTDAATGQVLSK
jgi:uncharacterized membrane protein HdeD (DUF308 family)